MVLFAMPLLVGMAGVIQGGCELFVAKQRELPMLIENEDVSLYVVRVHS